METYYDRDYSLSKMTTEAYVRDPRFEVIGVAVKVNDYPTDWYTGTDPGRFLKSLDYRDKAILAHNTVFDGAILSWHFGIKPKLWLDTLSMARPLHNVMVGGSLKMLTAHYRLGEKGDEVLNALGKRRLDFTTYEMQRYASYCCNDVELTYKLFRKMARGFPVSELMIIDQTLRMYTEPTLTLNRDVLTEHLDNEVLRKEDLLNTLGNAAAFLDPQAARETLMSNEKFATYLKVLGIDPPMKTSLTTGKLAWAFSKSDKNFTSLLEHDNPFVADAVGARLGVKSTIEESRTRSLLGVSERGTLPIMLNYYGAHTGRFSGGDKMNLQNLPRGGALRRSICAPAGKLLVACDSAQIEARVLAWVAGQHDLVQAFAEGRDIYSEFASEVYGRKVTKADKLERFVGKTCLSANTRVLTRRGWVPIITVRNNDQLWDGVEWVSHHGVSFMGVKPTIKLSGVELTPDHEILTAATKWETAHAVLKNNTAFQSALSMVTLPSLDMKNTQHYQVGCGVGGLCVGAVDAGQSLLTQTTTCAPEDQPRVTGVQNARHLTNGGGNIKPHCRMISTAADYLIDYPLLSDGATTQPTACLSTTVGGGYTYLMNGAQTPQHSSYTPKHCLGGTTQSETWIGSTTTKGMNPETYGSQQDQRTLPTNGVLTTLKPVFDILNSGSRNRFTILTDDGPIIVHNCILGLGYGMGSAKFRDALALGMGGIKVEIDMGEAGRIVGLYRDKNQRVVALWNRCNTALSKIIEGDELVLSDALSTLVTSKEGIALPNGLFIRYPLLTQYQNGYAYAGDARVYRETVKAKVTGSSMPYDKFTRIYGGKVVENMVQALARIVVAEQMAIIGRRYKVVLQVHDEVVILCDEAEVEEAKAYMVQVMSTPPSWAPDLPVACEADHGPNYGECK
jgi:hypothetical protein